MKKVLLMITVPLLAAILLTGCTLGGGAYTPTGTPLPSGVTAGPTPTVRPLMDPTDIIPKADAEQILGIKLKDPVPAASATPYTQSVALQQGVNVVMMTRHYDPVDSGRFLEISVYEETAALRGDPKLLFDAQRTPAPQSPTPVPSGKTPAPTPAPTVAPAGPIIAEVPGVGDEAFIANPGIHIYYKGYYIIISVGDPNDKANQELLTKLGKKAVENIAKKIGG